MIPRFGGYLRIEKRSPDHVSKRGHDLKKLVHLVHFYANCRYPPWNYHSPLLLFGLPKKKVVNKTTKFHTFGCLLFCNVMIPDAQLCTVRIFIPTFTPKKLPEFVGKFWPTHWASGGCHSHTLPGCHGASGRVTFPSWDGGEGPKGRKLKSNVTKKNLHGVGKIPKKQDLSKPLV